MEQHAKQDRDARTAETHVIPRWNAPQCWQAFTMQDSARHFNKHANRWNSPDLAGQRNSKDDRFTCQAAAVEKLGDLR